MLPSLTEGVSNRAFNLPAVMSVTDNRAHRVAIWT